MYALVFMIKGLLICAYILGTSKQNYSHLKKKTVIQAFSLPLFLSVPSGGVV